MPQVGPARRQLPVTPLLVTSYAKASCHQFCAGGAVGCWWRGHCWHLGLFAPGSLDPSGDITPGPSDITPGPSDIIPAAILVAIPSGLALTAASERDGPLLPQCVPLVLIFPFSALFSPSRCFRFSPKLRRNTATPPPPSSRGPAKPSSAPTGRAGLAFPALLAEFNSRRASAGRPAPPHTEPATAVGVAGTTAS